MRKFHSIVLLNIFLFLLPLSAFSGDSTVMGLQWLTSVQQTEGNWGEWNTPVMRNTTAVAEVFQLLNPTSSSYAAALQWLGTAGSMNNDDVSRRLIIFSKTTNDIISDLNYLLSAQKLEGGWGLDSENESGSINTALALQALKAANYTDTMRLFQAINFLTTNQNTDGGWGNNKGYETSYESDVYTTALVLKALSSYIGTFQLQNSIQKAASYLFLKQNSDGGFGASTSDVYETALAFEALVSSGQGGVMPLQNAINYITSTQLPDGSWNDDPYSTALALRALAYVKPNLTITQNDIVLLKSMPTVGETITITATVKNTGLEASENVVVNFYDHDPSLGALPISSQTVATIPAGGSAPVSVTYQGQNTGAAYIYVVIDPNNQIPEVNESDNLSSARFWVATAPDLAVFSEDIKPSTFTPAPGTPFTVEYTIRNLGESATDGFDVSIYDGPSTGSGQAGGILLQTVHISGIGGAELRTGTMGVTLTGNGPHTLYLVADSGNAISELSKTNNTGTVAVNVGAAPTLADLAITPMDITLSPPRPHAGDTVQISARLRNQGAESADNFTLEIYDGEPVAGGATILSQVFTLPAGAEQTVTTNWAIPTGIHEVNVILDRGNQVAEISETNNRAVTRVMTDMVDIALSATDLVLNPGHPVVGDTVALTITAHNQGIKDTGAFNLALYDGDPNTVGAPPATPLQTFQIANIPGDGSATLTYTFTAAAHTYRFYAVADSDNTVVEMYEGNNIAVRSLKVKGSSEILGPDLVPIKIDTGDTTTDPQTLKISGTVHVTIQNNGDDKITTPFNVIIFDDTDMDGRYTQGVDTLLGTATNSMTLWPEGANIIDVPLSGSVKFLHAPLYAFVDSGDVILEQDETNNLLVSCKDCQVVPANPIQAVVKWRWKDTANYWPSTRTPPTIMYLRDTNNDGKIDQNDIPDIVLNTSIGNGSTMKGNIWAFKGDTGDYQKIYDPNHAPYTIAYPVSGDIDGDGKPEIVIPLSHANSGSSGYIVYNNDWTLKWDNAQQVKAWNDAHPPTSSAYYSAYIRDEGIPALADLDGDGKTEIIMGATVVNADGSIRCPKNMRLGSGEGWSYSLNIGPYSIVADLDMDGKQEIIAGNTAYDSNCNIKWWNKSLTDGLNAIIHVDGDPYPGIVLIADWPVAGQPAGARLYLLDHNGNIKWGPVYLWQIYKQVVGTLNPYAWTYTSPPIVADFDGDGIPDIGIRSNDKILVFNKDGQFKNALTIPNYFYGATSSAPTVFDLNGDGIPEVMINSGGYFKILNGKDGSTLFQDVFGGADNIIQTVLVADVDGDGQVEVVVVGTQSDGWYGVMRVYGSADPNHPWVNGRRIWNEPSYHVTNVNDDGSIPQHEAPSWLTNNTYRTQAAIGKHPNPYLTPNMTASYLRAEQAGTSINLAVRVGNGGAAGSPAMVTVTFYDGPSTGSGQALTGDMIIGTAVTTRSLNPGEYQDVTYGWTGASLGIHHVYAVVDAANIITECRKDDNQTNTDITVQTEYPDLKIGSEDISLPGGPYYEGTPVPITATVRNIGGLQASNITVRLYNGNPSSGGIQIGVDQVIPTLNPGSTAAAAFSYDTIGKSGTNLLYFVVDPLNNIVESNEANNTASVSFQVQAPVLPDLVISTDNIQLSSVAPQEGDRITINATVRNLGIATSNIPVRIYLGNPSSGGSLISDQTIFPVIVFNGSATIQANLDTIGLAGQREIFVVVDPANAVTESREDNNAASRQIFIQSAALTSNMALEKSAYQANDTVISTIALSNQTTSSRNLTLGLYIKDSANNTVATVAIADPFTIDSNGTINFNRTWNTGKTLNGTYTMTAEVSESGRVISRAQSSFGIMPDKRLNPKVSADKMQYSSGESVSLTTVITSLSPNYIFENLTAKIRIADANGSPVYNSSKTVATLMPGASFNYNTYWSASNHSKGIYNVILDLYSGETVLVSSTTTFEILSTSMTGAGLTGAVTAGQSPVYQGKEERLSYSVTNNGNEDIANLILKILIVDPDTGEAKAEVGGQWSVARGETITEMQTLSTVNLAPKTYLAILQMTSAVPPKALANTTFEVLPGLEIKQTIADSGRALVWINDGCEGTVPTTPAHPYQGGEQEKWIRKDLIEKAMDEIGVTYRIVTDKKEFQKELRNNLYTDYLILGDFNPVEDGFVSELRERVFSGKGLISSLWHTQRIDGNAFGINSVSRLSGNNYPIEFKEGGLFQQQTLASYGEAAKIEPADGDQNILGWMSETTKKGTNKYPAIIRNEYGNGKVLFYAFDLGMSVNEANYSRIVEILKASLNYIHRPAAEKASYMPYDLVTLRTEVKSLGGSFDLNITESYPSGIKLFDFSTGQWITDNPWAKEMSLNAYETRNITLFALAPDEKGTYTVTTDVGYLEEGSYKPYQSLSVEIKVDKESYTLINDILYSLSMAGTALSDGNESAKTAEAMRYIEGVRDRVVYTKDDLEYNIRDVLKAVDAISAIKLVDTREIRLDMDRLIGIYEGKWNINP